MQQRHQGSGASAILALEEEACRPPQLAQKFFHIVAQLHREWVTNKPEAPHSGQSATGWLSVLCLINTSSN